MNQDTMQTIFTNTDQLLSELEGDQRTTLKALEEQVANKTGQTLSSVRPVIRAYLQNKDGYTITPGRNGGIKRNN